MPLLHRFTKVLAGATFLLLIAGGLVTSTGSGLSVPDWPTTYGWSMFTFPLSKWVGGIVYEHGHRLIASTVGMLTIVMVVAYWRTEPRRWVRRLTLVALAAVVAQGLLGGLTVLTKLPPAVSSAHAGLAEIFFALTVSLAVFTSRGWATAYEAGRAPASASQLARDAGLRRLSVATICVVYLQIILGAVMRHTGAGLAIPDFPLMFGRLVPPIALVGNPPVAIHLAHRIGALLVAGCAIATAWRVFARHTDRTEIVRPALLLLALLVVQITLGGLTVLTARNVAVNTAHLAVGALVFATSVVLALRVNRSHFADVAGAAAFPRHAAPASAQPLMRERKAGA